MSELSRCICMKQYMGVLTYLEFRHQCGRVGNGHGRGKCHDAEENLGDESFGDQHRGLTSCVDWEYKKSSWC